MRYVTWTGYLDSNNIWTERLLSETSLYRKNRTLEQIEDEYNIEKYGGSLKDAQKDIEGFRRRILYSKYNEQIRVAIRDDIYLMPVCMYTALKRNRILGEIEKYCGSEQICELGAGYGQNLIWLHEYQDRAIYGGDYSENAVILGKMLGCDIHKFNFYQDCDYNFIRNKSSILTVHAIEQIKDAAIVINSLRNIKDKIKYILHFEPVYDETRRNLIGLLRNKYIRINDYNINLLDCLIKGTDIEIVHRELDVFGNNPLNPTSIIVWKFKS